MGYDNALGNQIGITLIATGFEHKDPFDRPGQPAVQKEAAPEKIILTLGAKEEEKVEKVEKVPVAVVPEEKDELAPILVDLRKMLAFNLLLKMIWKMHRLGRKRRLYILN